jgi:hypothetical protein
MNIEKKFEKGLEYYYIMQKNISLISIYKFPLMISITVAIAVLAIRAATDPLVIGMIISGALLGAFVLDIEYFIYAYVFEPQKDFSQTLTAFVKHRDFLNTARYIEFHRNEIKDKSLNSAVFQIVLSFLALYIVSSNSLILIKTLVISILANSLYKFAQSYFDNQLQEWFWALKEIPSKQGLILYTALVFGSFVYCLYVI